ncbi:hypothetical protein DFH09DRAFT_1339526 [Mycena vulgaris]|nr:hypothetical protein DFH09DRAFT_1339526 [Mycena vulgaris]
MYPGSPPAHAFPSRSLRSSPALFYGHENHDGDVYRPFVSGVDNNTGLSSAELPALLRQTGGFRFITFHVCSIPFHLRQCAYVPGFLPAGRLPLRSLALAEARTHLPRVPPVPLYPVRRSRWSSSSLLRRPSSSLGLSALHRAGSAKRERLTTTNELIFRVSAFPHDGDGDPWRRPQLEHEPVFCRHASSRMQRVRGLDPRLPRHFPCAFGVHARTCADVLRSFFLLSQTRD